MNRLRRAASLTLATVVLLTGAAACGADPEPDTATAVTIPASIPAHEGARARLDGFEEVTVTVVTEDGRTLELCLLLASTPEQHERGLMFVTDPSLGGYDGMLFQFDRDGTGAFWMKDTRLPLTVAYLAADGSIVSTADMAPCPDGTERCPSYPPDGPYRSALEVVQGRLDDLGLEGDARLTVGGSSCAPPGGASGTTAPPASSST